MRTLSPAFGSFSSGKRRPSQAYRRTPLDGSLKSKRTRLGAPFFSSSTCVRVRAPGISSPKCSGSDVAARSTSPSGLPR